MISTNRMTAGVGLLRARVPAVRMLTRVARSPMRVLALVSDAVGTSHVYAHAFVRACTDGYRSSNASHRRQTRRHTCRDIIGRLYVLHEHAAVVHTYVCTCMCWERREEGFRRRAFCPVKSNNPAVPTARGIAFAERYSNRNVNGSIARGAALKFHFGIDTFRHSISSIEIAARAFEIFAFVRNIFFF